MSPHLNAPVTWEGHCKPYLIVFSIFSSFSRWGARYAHGNDDVRETILDFAAEKLLCTDPRVQATFTDAQVYAVLSHRLALDAHTPGYRIESTSPFTSVKIMHEQIAKHLRVVVAVDDRNKSLRAIAPSEPVLSEAASRIMLTKNFSLPDALSRVLTRHCVNRGNRGELVVTSLFTWARDQVVKVKGRSIGQLCPYFSVTELFQRLFTKQKYAFIQSTKPSFLYADNPKSFGVAFENAMMHFNHLIKPQDQEVVARKYLPDFLARGAAALGVDRQSAFNAVYPYLYHGKDLDVKQLGFIIIHVRNDPIAVERPEKDLDELFSNMDPFRCGLINDDDKEHGRFPIPIICIVFLLSANRSPTKDVWQHMPSRPITKKDRPLFTSYDYVCRFMKDALLPLEDSPQLWEMLVDNVSDWRSFYDRVGEVDERELRSGLPACAVDGRHHNLWY